MNFHSLPKNYISKLCFRDWYELPAHDGSWESSIPSICIYCWSGMVTLHGDIWVVMAVTRDNTVFCGNAWRHIQEDHTSHNITHIYNTHYNILQIHIVTQLKYWVLSAVCLLNRFSPQPNITSIQVLACNSEMTLLIWIKLLPFNKLWPGNDYANPANFCGLCILVFWDREIG
jgi:hypothetical protein